MRISDWSSDVCSSDLNGGVESGRSRASGPECREGVCMSADRRPLSPHLQIYKPQLTSVMSISHRATGVGLAAGTLVLAWWLIAAAAGPAAFATVQGFLGSWFGYLILFGFSYALKIGRATCGERVCQS